jgi:hypothetical protein
MLAYMDAMMSNQVFDLRMLRLTTPITFSTPHGPGPVFTRFFPQYSSTVVLGGVTGRFQVQDITDSAIPIYFSVRTLNARCVCSLKHPHLHPLAWFLSDLITAQELSQLLSLPPLQCTCWHFKFIRYYLYFCFCCRSATAAFFYSS